MKNLRLHDKTCLHIAQLLQLAMLTGQDVTHLFRGMLLTEDNGYLLPNEEYFKNFEEEINNMTAKASEMSKKEEEKAQKPPGFVQ